MARALICLALACAAVASAAGGATGTPDLPTALRFQNAYHILLKADEARDERRMAEAVSLYRSAHDMYTLLIEAYPEWQPRVVRFRIAYCGDQITQLAGQGTNSMAGGTVAGVSNIVFELPQPAAPDRPDRRLPADELAAVKDSARALIRQGKADEARLALLKALNIHPDDADIRLLLAVAQCRSGNFDDAVFILSDLAREHPAAAPVRMALGTAYFGQGKHGEAAAELVRVVELDPRALDAHFNLVQVYLQIKPPDLDAAREHYRKFLELGGKADEDLDGVLE